MDIVTDRAGGHIGPAPSRDVELGGPGAARKARGPAEPRDLVQYAQRERDEAGDLPITGSSGSGWCAKLLCVGSFQLFDDPLFLNLQARPVASAPCVSLSTCRAVAGQQAQRKGSFAKHRCSDSRFEGPISSDHKPELPSLRHWSVQKCDRQRSDIYCSSLTSQTS